MGAITTTFPLEDGPGRAFERLLERSPSVGAAEPVHPEAALLAAAQRGDRGAFATIVQLHQRAVYGYLCARLVDAADAEDLCQEVFLRCYVGHEKIERASAIRPWLLGIAANLLREHARRKQRRREVAWTELCLELESFADLPEAREEALVHLPECLASLGKSAREALELKYHARLKLQEIGVRLCRSEGAVKLLMFRARQALRRCLAGKLAPHG
jgi:RNA polymerase sigma-70 factor (ECF subfamily)